MEPNEAPPVEETTFSVSFTVAELGIIGGCGALLLIGLIIFLVYLSRRTQDQFGGDQDFERNLLREVAATQPPAPPDSIQAETSAPLQSPPIPSPNVPTPVSSSLPPGPPDADPKVLVLAQRLRNMGVIGAFLKTQSLGFGPEAQIYSLAAGGTVLILPRMESEAFLTHAVHSHAMVIAPTSEGGALMIMPLGDKLSVSVHQEERIL